MDSVLCLTCKTRGAHDYGKYHSLYCSQCATDLISSSMAKVIVNAYSQKEELYQ